jgi:hypothetical protein
MRIRTVKPEFWTDEQMSMISEFSRLLAIALLNYSDDDGYFLANPILIRGACFPFLDDYKKIPRSIQELSEIGFLDIGLLDDGRQVGKIVNFRKHQRIDKPQLSKLKEKSQFQEHSKNDPRTLREPSKTILGGNGMEQGMGMEQGNEFQEFWTSYPKKVSKPQAERAFQKAIKKTDLGKILESVNSFKNSEDWTKEDGKYIPNPATWLNGERWNDNQQQATPTYKQYKPKPMDYLND